MSTFCLYEKGFRDVYPGNPVNDTKFTVCLDENGKFLSGGKFCQPNEGGGYVAYSSGINVSPIEVQTEFLKADNAEKWLKGLVIRHVMHTGDIDTNEWIYAEMMD